MRDRLTARYDALNVEMLVRFQLPQLLPDPVVQRLRLLAYTQTTMVRVHPGSLIQTPRYANQEERLDLRSSDYGFDSLLGHLEKARLGRQSADHVGLEPEMLWVRIPPEPLIDTSLQSSPECSPPCHGGDRGFKSHQGRLQPGTVRKRKSDEAQTFVIVCGFDSHSCYSIWVGLHRRATLAVTQWSLETLAVRIRPDPFYDPFF